MGELRPIDGGRDPFKMESSTYDHDEFYVAHVDKRGHRDRFQVSIPQGTAGAIERVARDMPAYQSRGDFIADAIHHRLQYCFEKLGEPEDLGQVLASDRLKARAAKQLSEMRNAAESVQEVGDALEFASQMRDARAMESVLGWALEAVEEMDDPYRTMLMEKIKRYQSS